MKFDSKKDTINYIDKLLENGIEIDYHRLKFILDRNSIEIKDIIFCDRADLSELSLISITLNFDESVDISIKSFSWNKYLPAIYQDNEFLKNFLYGIQTTALTQDELIVNISELFTPENTKFIDWLSSWFGIKYHLVVTDEAKRVMLYNIIDLYQCRGTKKYFQKLIKILVDIDVDIIEYSTISEYTYLESKKPKNLFTIVIKDKISEDLIEEKEKLKIITNIINKEKPINTEAKIEYSFINANIDDMYEDSIVEYQSSYKESLRSDDGGDHEYDY